MADEQPNRPDAPTAEPPARPPGRPPAARAGPAGRVLQARVPVWALLALLLAVAVAFGALLLQAGSGVELGPAVATARDVEVRITLCNADVDRLEINPRAAELDLEETLVEEGASDADVIVNRLDCPRVPVGTGADEQGDG